MSRNVLLEIVRKGNEHLAELDWQSQGDDKADRQQSTATYPDRETAQWATQQVGTANEQLVHRCLPGQPRLTIEASWPSRTEPVDRALIQAMMKLSSRRPCRSSGDGCPEWQLHARM